MSSVCPGVVSQSFEQNMYAEFVVVPLEYFPHLPANVAAINTVLFVPSTNKTAGFYLKWLLSEGLLFPLWEICICPKGRSRGVQWAVFIVLPSPTEFWLLKCPLSWLISNVFKQLLPLFSPGFTVFLCKRGVSLIQTILRAISRSPEA